MSIKDISKVLTKSVGIAIQNAYPYLFAVLDPFFKAHPEWQLAFYSAIGLYGVYLACNQEEVNNVIRFIKDHPGEFRAGIVKTEEFRKGFLLFFEQYLKQRLEEKKKILKEIFLGFTVSDKKEKYDLERLNTCLERISLNSLEFLIFINKEIFPKLESEVNKELEKDQYRISDRSKEWWFSEIITKKSVWDVINSWLHENYDPSSNKVKEMYQQPKNEGWMPDKQHRADTRAKDKRNEVHEAMVELVSLNILNTKVAGITYGGGGGTDYSLTQFGIRFLMLINEVKDS